MGRGRSPRSRWSRPSRGKSPSTFVAEVPAGWLPLRTIGEVVVVADWVVVGSVLVVVGPVVVGSAVVVGAAVAVEAAVVVGEVVVLGVVTGGWVVAPGEEWVLVTVVLLQGGASVPISRLPVAIGRLVADGLVSGLPVGGEGVVVGCVVVPVVKDMGAGSAVTVGRATPGARCGGGAWGGNKVAEATRAARTAVVSPKATSSSLQGRRGLARCRGDGFGMGMVPVRRLLWDEGCPCRRPATGHIGRSLAERIEWCVHVRCRPTPLAYHQPIRLNLDQAAAPRAAALGFSLNAIS